jgi:hypothetical protein
VPVLGGGAFWWGQANIKLSNPLLQMMALGRISLLAEGRQVVRNSSEVLLNEPGDRTG